MVQKSGGSPPGILIKTCKYWDDEQPIKLNWGYPPEIVLVDTKDNGLEHVPQTWLFWVSMLEFLEVVSRIFVEVFC